MRLIEKQDSNSHLQSAQLCSSPALLSGTILSAYPSNRFQEHQQHSSTCHASAQT